MYAHSAAVCQCNSRTPPAVSRMFTPASDFETGSSRTVTSRDHPPSCNRLCAMEKGYLNVGTPPASVGGGFTESAFCASIAGFFGTGSLRLRSPCAFCAESWLSPAALLEAIIPAASAAELAPRNPRRVQRSFSDSSAIRAASCWSPQHLSVACITHVFFTSLSRPISYRDRRNHTTQDFARRSHQQDVGYTLREAGLAAAHFCSLRTDSGERAATPRRIEIAPRTDARRARLHSHSSLRSAAGSPDFLHSLRMGRRGRLRCSSQAAAYDALPWARERTRNTPGKRHSHQTD